MLIFSSVSKNYGAFQALKNVSFSVNKGEIAVLLGSNGAGKSTVIKIAAGIFKPSAGTVSVNGADPLLKETRRIIGYMPEDYDLPEYEESFEWLKTWSAVKNGKKEDVKEIFSACGLKKAAGSLIGSLSKGYRQRLSLAAALTGSPSLILLDEPTSGLDPIQSEEIRNILKKASDKSAILISTHILEDAKTLSDKIFVFKSGELKTEADSSMKKESADLMEKIRQIL